MPTLVFIHSPLLGPFTWQSVAHHLYHERYHVFTPDLQDDPQHTLPLWQQQVQSIDLPVHDAWIVGHSGAGALLPALGEKLQARGYIYVDAVLLFEPATRLDLLRTEDRDFADALERDLRSGGRFPTWTDEQLGALIPDADLRRKLLADLRPRGLRFFTERIDVPQAWDTKVCVYIQLSDTYTPYAAQAESRQWKVIRYPSHHFAMLTHPAHVAELLVQALT